VNLGNPDALETLDNLDAIELLGIEKKEINNLEII
jgi:hypothetical protein